MISGLAEYKHGKLILHGSVEAELEKKGDAKYEIQLLHFDKPHYWLHQYYRGYLIPDICNYIGDSDKDMMHWFFKSKFLTYQFKDLKDVDKKYRKTSRIIAREKEIVDYETGEVVEVKRWYDVTLSTGSINGVMFREYINKVEQFFMEFLGGHYSKRMEDEGMQYRDKGFNDGEESENI